MLVIVLLVFRFPLKNRKGGGYGIGPRDYEFDDEQGSVSGDDELGTGACPFFFGGVGWYTGNRGNYFSLYPGFLFLACLLSILHNDDFSFFFNSCFDDFSSSVHAFLMFSTPLSYREILTHDGELEPM